MGSRFIEIRTALGLNQKQFAQLLCISNSLISAIENGDKKPSEILIELVIYKLGISREWLIDKDGEMFASDTQRIMLTPDLSSKAMVTAAVVGPVFPQVTLGIMASVGISHVIKRMCSAYGAKNPKELASKYLMINNSTISSWKRKNKIPDNYLIQTSQDTGTSMKSLLSNELTITIERTIFFNFIKSLKDVDEFNAMDNINKNILLDQYLNNLKVKN